MSTYLSKLGGRKFGLCLAVVIFSSLFLVVGKIDQGSLISILKFVLGGYVATVVGQTYFVGEAESATFENKELLGRKFILSCITYLLTCLLVLFGFVSAENYTQIVYAVCGIYLTGNVGDKVAAIKAAKPSTEP